ncbi:hypothetical protein Tsubulata_005119 [Turnera subulata]|uniref:RRM domain-containing protein n=1 Tax=Turnera subulata TaxID=218843 RepID=A0A9Q0FSJ5_9ROSI|nr:hypothetical protein Tsubulata_005119 [Turnera subulata]
MYVRIFKLCRVFRSSNGKWLIGYFVMAAIINRGTNSGAFGKGPILEVNHPRKPLFFSRWSKDYIQKGLKEGRLVSLYIENIPSGWFPSDVFREMARFGVVMDGFIPGKLTWSRIRYGFVRFEKKGDVNGLVERISKNGNGMLQVKVARDRKLWGGSIKGSQIQRQPRVIRDNRMVRERITYSQVAGADSSSSSKLDNNALARNDADIVFSPTKVIMDKLKTCAFGMLKIDVPAGTIEEAFRTYAGVSVDVKTLGGEYVLISFDSKESMSKCIHDGVHWMSELFLLIKEWKEGDFASNRVCWLNIYGAPPQAWCEDFFKCVTIRAGKFIRLFNDLEGSNNLDVAKVQIMTTYKEPINRLLKVLIGGQHFDFSVVEAQPPCPTPLSSISTGQNSHLKRVSDSSDDRCNSGSGVNESPDPFRILETIKRLGKGEAVRLDDSNKACVGSGQSLLGKAPNGRVFNVSACVHGNNTHIAESSHYPRRVSTSGGELLENMACTSDGVASDLGGAYVDGMQGNKASSVSPGIEKDSSRLKEMCGPLDSYTCSPGINLGFNKMCSSKLSPEDSLIQGCPYVELEKGIAKGQLVRPVGEEVEVVASESDGVSKAEKESFSYHDDVDISLQVLQKHFRILLERSKSNKNMRMGSRGRWKKIKKLTKDESVRTLHSGESSTQESNIIMGNCRATAASGSIASFKSAEVEKTLNITKELGLEFAGHAEDLEKLVEGMVDKERADWEASRVTL